MQMYDKPKPIKCPECKTLNPAKNENCKNCGAKLPKKD
jgi:RNA polymerase subunit RPABC4/transcription elongation factor Spt4